MTLIQAFHGVTQLSFTPPLADHLLDTGRSRDHSLPCRTLEDHNLKESGDPRARGGTGSHRGHWPLELSVGPFFAVELRCSTSTPIPLEMGTPVPKDAIH